MALFIAQAETWTIVCSDRERERERSRRGGDKLQLALSKSAACKLRNNSLQSGRELRVDSDRATSRSWPAQARPHLARNGSCFIFFFLVWFAKLVRYSKVKLQELHLRAGQRE